MQRLISVLILLEAARYGGTVPADHGSSLGRLHITMAVVLDVNRVYYAEFKHSDACHPVRSRQIAALWLSYWSKQIGEERKCPLSYEEMARLWLGGPRGLEKNCTLDYGRRAAALMEELP